MTLDQIIRLVVPLLAAIYVSALAWDWLRARYRTWRARLADEEEAERKLDEWRATHRPDPPPAPPPPPGYAKIIGAPSMAGMLDGATLLVDSIDVSHGMLGDPTGARVVCEVSGPLTFKDPKP